MKRIIIICEGQTEQSFCKTILYPHFLEHNILIEAPTIKKSGGGIVNWSLLKREINLHLLSKDAIVTTLIDYYGIHNKHLFPQWEEAKKIIDIQERVTALEGAMQQDIEDNLRFRFIPYIQLHEFEGLLFNNIEVFKSKFNPNEFANFAALEDTILNYPNPELINDGKTTAPSKRLDAYIKGYNKIIHGTDLAKAISLSAIRSKSPRFNHWIETLENS